MKQIDSIAGKCYIATAPNGGTVTDEAGRTLATVEAGEQKAVWGTDGKLYLSDDDGKLVLANFKHALAAAGLLGGGADKLPAGYTRAEFLESTGTQYINVPRALTVAPDCTFVYKAQLTGGTSGSQHAFGARVAANSKEFGVSYNVTSSTINVMLGGGRGAFIPYTLAEPHELKANGATGKVVVSGGESYALNPVEITMSSIGVFRREGIGYSYFIGRIFKASIYNNGQQFLNLIPTLDSTGVPCMYDTVTKTAYKRAGSGQFIAGFTLSQARKLGKLPAGTTLTISLPVGYDSDAGVVAALAEAEANGCILTIQTYEAAGAAAATFALRRVWVRRVQDENGSYVAADGSRWQVDWCVDVIGADPEAIGFERFRSVDSAVAYWELVPYQYPEEELSTEA